MILSDGVGTTITVYKTFFVLKRQKAPSVKVTSSFSGTRGHNRRTCTRGTSSWSRRRRCRRRARGSRAGNAADGTDFRANGSARF